jgi:hypothetical protein
MNSFRQHFWYFALVVVLIFTGIYVILAAVLSLFQSRFVYFPVRHFAASPGDIGLSYDAVAFESADGIQLSGWFVRAPRPRGVALFCHGNGGNISYCLESVQILNRLRLSVFLFDYRGYGTSSGEPTEQGTYLDAEAAWRWLVEQKGIPPDQIILFGRSLGGSVAAWLAQHREPRALIVESAFTSIPDIGADAYPLFPVRLLCRYSYSCIDYVRHVKVPVLVVHSRDDEIIPFSHGERLYEAAHQPKAFLELSGGHNDGFIVSGGKYESGLDAFLGSL